MCPSAAGLKSWDVVVGTGTPVAAGDSITIFYTGWLASNGTKFDSRRSPATPITFSLNGLIQGWQQMFPPPAFEKNWRASLLQSTLFEFGTHALDLICFFFEALPTSIVTIITYPRSEVAADVVVVCTLTFPGQRAASLVMNRVSHAPERYLEMRVDCHDASIRISLGGVARLAFDWSKPLGRQSGRQSRTPRSGRPHRATGNRER